MKVVYLNPTGVLGGAEMCLLDLLASLQPLVRYGQRWESLPTR